MKRVLSGLVAVGIAAASFGCNPFAPDQSVVLLVDQLDAPASISAGSPLTVVLTVIVGGCKVFDRISVQRGASGATMIAFGQDIAKGKDLACTDNAVPESHSYQFDPPFQNPFTVRVDREGLDPLITTVQVH
ncbi:MAG TPA: hypothetical protein VGN73_08215 [Gemmatimonadaceae bacterium]|nr:hypothetical protein [Gemmatimonadaceae bacterium]